MKEILLKLDGNNITVLKKENNDFTHFKIRGEDSFYIETIDDVFEIKNYIRREMEDTKIKFTLVYLKNVPQSLLHVVYLGIILKEGIDSINITENKVEFQSLNLDSFEATSQVVGKYFQLKTPIKNDIDELVEEKNSEYTMKILALENENKKIKTESRKLRIEMEKERAKLEIQKIKNKLNEI